jgi:hypothetical protein
MRTQKEVEEMYSFIGFFNDGSFMDAKYRQGILHALSFVLYERNITTLQTIKEHFLDKKVK